MNGCAPIERNLPATDKQTNILSVEHFFSFWSRLDLFFFSIHFLCNVEQNATNWAKSSLTELEHTLKRAFLGKCILCRNIRARDDLNQHMNVSLRNMTAWEQNYNILLREGQHRLISNQQNSGGVDFSRGKKIPIQNRTK